jgi:DnaK suppressor protein
MTHNDLQLFKTILQQKQTELLETLCRRDGLLIEQSADALETVLSAQARQQTADTLTRTSDLLVKVRAALKRMADGEFGICIRCDDDIALKRLQAVPWTTLCLKCQDKADRQPAAA